MKAKIVKAQTLQAKIQDTKTFNAIMRWGLVIHENIELSKQWEYIVWRTVGKLDWKRLIPIEELKVKWDKGDDWIKWYTPQKWIDYFDWVKWKDGSNGKDWVKWKDGSNGKDWDNWLSAFELWKLEEWNKNKKLQDFWNWLRREWEHIVMAWSLNVVPTGWTTWQVLKKKSNNDFDLEWGTWWGGWGGIVETIVAWNNIDVDNTDPANPIVSVETLTLTDISDVTASATEVNYSVWVTSSIQTQLNALANGMIYKGNWDASTWTFPWAWVAKIWWFYTVSVAWTVDWQVFNVWDRLIAIVDNASTTVFSGNWTILDATDAVTSVFGRIGNVVSANWDYTASQVTNVPAGNIAGTTVQTAINELDTEKEPTLTGTTISSKPLLAPLVWTEEVLINDGWTLKKTTAQDIADLWGWGGGWSQPYTALSADATITQWNVYWVTASTVDINLTLSDWTVAWQTLTVKKLDDTDYSVFINNANIDWETSLELTIEDESIDLYRTWTAFIIK